MIQVTAQASGLRYSPRKLRLTADLVRPLKPAEALSVLKHTNKRAAPALYKVIKQAISNAVNNFKLAQDSLAFKTVEINEGPVYKRSRAAARGRGHSIKKRTSHIKVILEAKARQDGTKS